MSVSVVIPVFKDDAALVKLLKTLSGMNPNEIVIADAEDRTTLPQSLQSISVKHVRAEQGRGPQIAAGMAAATHPLIWVLHADVHPPRQGIKTITEAFQDPTLFLLTFTLRFDRPSVWLSLFAWLARWDSAVSTFGDQGFAFRKSDYEELGLDLNAYPLMEDVALRRALKKRGKTRRSPLKIITSARRFETHGPLKTQGLNLCLLIRYFLGASPDALYERYYHKSAPQE